MPTQDEFDEVVAVLIAIKVKLHRWQKTIDGGSNPRNPIVQQARDETRQECINAIQSIIDKLTFVVEK